MKKVITFLSVLTLFFVSGLHAQKKSVTSDTVSIDIQKVRFIKIGDQVHDLQTEIPLFLPFQWILSAYDFIDNAKSGLSKKEVEQLQLPLKQYWDYYEAQSKKQQTQKK